MPVCLRGFKVIPLAQWAALWWLHWTIILETGHFSGKMTRWFSQSPTNLYDASVIQNNTAFWNHFLFWFQLLDFIGKWFSLCQKEDFISAFWIISVSMLLFSSFKDETLPSLFDQFLFITMISAVILFIFIQLEVISCSLDNTELFWMLETLTLTTFLTSGSSSDTSSNRLSNQHCFLFQRKEGQSNHLFIWSSFLESNPCKASSAGLLLLSTKCHFLKLAWSLICWT